MRAETRIIINTYYNDIDWKIFERFAKIIKNDCQHKKAQREIWKYDQSLGGLGGYATPLNPRVNPFNSWGDYRNVFRSLQYARCDMFFCSRPRHIILDAALHIETLVKLVVSNKKIIKFIYNHRELGKNISHLYNEKIIDHDLFKRLTYLRKLLNYAKHDTAPNKDNSFDYEDAIVFYVESRIMGNKLLTLLNHETCNKIYKIKE